MKGRRQRKCLHCGELFYPDARNAHHQRYCAEPACRRASKAASQRRWLSKPANRDYFRGAANVERVRIWRAEHPGYTRRERSAAAQAPSALQDVCIGQAIEIAGESDQLAPSALQEFLTAQPIVLIGLIANLTGSALQEEIAFSARRFQQLGQDILSGRTPPVGGACDAENPVNPIPVPPGPASVQLDRSAPGA